MSQAHIDQFYAIAAKDPALVKRMQDGTHGPDDFARNAVKEAKTLGYDFTFDEASQWMKQQQAATAKGELSDSQLEAVAGGKQRSFTYTHLAPIDNTITPMNADDPPLVYKC